MWSLLGRIKRKVFSLFSQTIQNQNEQFIDSLANLEWKLLEKNDSSFILDDSLNKVFVRKRPSTDINVFRQVFIDEEYRNVCLYFINNKISCDFIIDAGGNAGYSLIYFKRHFPNVKVVTIEPDTNNFNILAKNIELNNWSQSALALNYALHTESGLSMTISDDFRGGGDWAKTTQFSDNETKLKSISINDVLEKYPTSIIDLLKIDIEGAERFLFESKLTSTFLSKTRVLAIEIHDEFNIREKIYSLLSEYSFIIFNSGETTIAINKNYL